MRSPRRFFWGNSLAQAVMAAARHHQVDPARLAYRIYEKRHGFVKHPRMVVIEVDPQHAQRAEGSPPPEAAAAAASPPKVGKPDRQRERPRREATRRHRPEPHGEAEAWESANEEAALAAAEGLRSLLRLGALELAPEVRIVEGGLEIELVGEDLNRLGGLGVTFLEGLDVLLPRIVRSLSGRLVRCRTDAGGLRGEHERELRRLAQEIAARVTSSGESEELPAMSAPDRRTIHMELAESPEVETFSRGEGAARHLVVRRRSRTEN